MRPSAHRGQAKSRGSSADECPVPIAVGRRCWRGPGSTRSGSPDCGAGTSRCRACGPPPMRPGTTSRGSAPRSAAPLRAHLAGLLICGGLLRRNVRAQAAAAAARLYWEDAAFGAAGGPDIGLLDHAAPAGRHASPGNARTLLSAAVSAPSADRALADCLSPGGRGRIRHPARRSRRALLRADRCRLDRGLAIVREGRSARILAAGTDARAASRRLARQ